MGEVPEVIKDGAFHQACVREIQIVQRGTCAYGSRNVTREILEQLMTSKKKNESVIYGVT